MVFDCFVFCSTSSLSQSPTNYRLAMDWVAARTLGALQYHAPDIASLLQSAIIANAIYHTNPEPLTLLLSHRPRLESANRSPYNHEECREGRCHSLPPDPMRWHDNISIQGLAGTSPKSSPAMRWLPIVGEAGFLDVIESYGSVGRGNMDAAPGDVSGAKHAGPDGRAHRIKRFDKASIFLPRSRLNGDANAL
jgi:hypothetical protein